MKIWISFLALLSVLAACSGDRVEPQAEGVAGLDMVRKATHAARVREALIGRASADQGALLEYVKNGAVPLRDGGMTLYPVNVSEAHAFNSLTTDEMTLPAPNWQQVKLRYERHAEDIGGNWTWIGRLDDERGEEAIVTFGDTAVFGTIPQADGMPALSLTTRGGSTYVVAMDPSHAVSGADPNGHARSGGRGASSFFRRPDAGGTESFAGDYPRQSGRA